MNNRQGPPPALPLSRTFYPRCRSIIPKPIFIAVLAAILGGCASPGEPIERKPPVPLAITDLSGMQSGNSVVLAFTLPQDTTDRRPLAQPPAIEIYRNFESAPGAAAPPLPAPVNPELLVTIPSAMVDQYATQGRIRYVDSLRASDFTQHPNSIAVYTVRTRASAKKESANSNAASLRLYPVPVPIEDAKAEITRSGIQITWTPPQNTPVGPAPPILAYRIYRATAPPATTVPSVPEATESNAPAPNGETAPPGILLTKIGETESPNYLDTQTQIGEGYVYSIRSLVQYSGATLESADSNLVSITARDVFPPRAPAGLVMVVVPAGPGGPARLDLSWEISSETDVAGYNVYRSEQAGVLGTRLNAQLLATPVFEDMTAVPGQRYFYSITAVDRSGNESPASAAVSGTVQAEGNPAP